MNEATEKMRIAVSAATLMIANVISNCVDPQHAHDVPQSISGAARRYDAVPYLQLIDQQCVK